MRAHAAPAVSSVSSAEIVLDDGCIYRRVGGNPSIYYFTGLYEC